MNIFFGSRKKAKSVSEEQLQLQLPSGQFIMAQLVLSTERKTAVIHIKQGEVIVRAPQKGSRPWLMAFLESKLSWIEARLGEERHSANTQNKKFEEGELFLCFGQDYPLRYEEGRPMGARFAEGELIVRVRKGLSDEERKKRAATLIEAHYRMIAIAHFTERSTHFGSLLGQHAREICVRDYKSRWGCCSREGIITYCWRTIMAPTDVVDYLVAHEMSHLVHMNHSDKFWSQVERLFPHYKSSRRWLKENGYRLQLNA